MISTYEVIFFDAGGTLFRPFPSVGEIYSDVARRYGTRVDADVIEKQFQQLWHEHDGLRDVDYSDEKKEKRWWYGFVKDLFSRWGGVPDFDRYFDELYDFFGSADCWCLYPETLDVLQALKARGHRLSIVSNWDRRLFKICEGLNIGQYFDFILASAVFGAAKPSSRIFIEALRRSGVSASQAVHIGDSLEDDVKGARAAGIETLLVDRGSRCAKDPEVFQGIRVIEQLTDLIT